MRVVLHMTQREMDQGTVLLKISGLRSLPLIFSVSRPPTASLPVTAVFIYLFSHLCLSPRLVLLSSHPFSLRSWWQRLGCDPITGWLRQSPFADWFYNPRWGSQMGENQLAEECCSQGSHTDAHTHTHTLNSFLPRYYIPLLDSISSLSFCLQNFCLCLYGRIEMSAQAVYLK